MARRSFRWRLVGMAVVLIIAPLAVVGWLLVDVNRRALEDATREHLLAVAEDVAHSVDGSLVEAETGLGAVAGALADAQMSPDHRIAVASRLVESIAPIRAVGVYDADGHRIDVMAESGADEPLPAELDASVRSSAVSAPPVVTDAVRGPRGPMVVMVLPVRGEHATWFVAAPIDLGMLETRVAALSRDELGDDLDGVFVVDRARHVIAHPDPERIDAAQTLPATGVLHDFPVTREGHPEALLVYGVYTSSRGKTAAIARSLDDLPWIVVAQRPYDRVFAPVARTRRVVIFGLVVTMLIAIALSIAWSMRLTSPIRELVAFAGDLAHRRFDRRVEIRTGDELEQLAVAMSAAASDLATSEKRLVSELAIRRDLGRYLPAELVERVVKRDADMALGGVTRDVTVLFADVTSFTSLVDRFPPNETVSLLNQVFTLLTEIVFAHGGTVDKFVGDCVMAFWGAPTAHDDHAQRAVTAAQSMLRWLELANEGWQSTFGATIHLAIGVNTGPAVVGNIGSESRMDYTCIGDTVNVGSRLEALARPQQILVSRATRDAAAGFQYIEVGTYAMPGRAEAVELYEVVAR